MRRKLALAITLMLACVTSLPGRAGHRDPKSSKKPIRSVVLMPLRINLTRMSMKGAESMMDEARDTELPLALEVEAALGDLGYRLDKRSLSTETLAKDADERYAVDDLQKKFDSELQLMRKKSKDVRKGRFTLGDEVAKLPLSDTVDALLFVRARAQLLTENKKAFGTFVAGARNDSTVMDFGLVDAKSGDVVYFGKSSVAADLTQDSEEIASGITKALANLPKAGAASLPAQPLPAQQEMPPSTADAPTTSAVESGTPPENPAASLVSTNAPASATPPRRIRLSHVALKNLLIQQVAPEYPGVAAASHIEGEVVMRVVIDRSGQIADATALSGPVQLIPAATKAVKQWRYRPLTVNGQALEVETQIVITFKFSA